MHAFIGGEIRTEPRDSAMFTAGMANAFDCIELDDAIEDEQSVRIYLTRGQTRELLRGMLEDMAIAAEAERILAERIEEEVRNV